MDLTHFQVARVAGALFSCRDPILVETGGTVYAEAVKAAGCGWIRYICRTSPEAACQLAPAQPFLVIPLTVSHLRPGQTVTTARVSAAAPTCLAWPGQGAQAQLSGSPQLPRLDPLAPRYSLGDPRGSQPQPRLYCAPLKLPGRSKKEGLPPSPTSRHTHTPSIMGSYLGLAPEAPGGEVGVCGVLLCRETETDAVRDLLTLPSALRDPWKAGAPTAGWSGPSGFLSPDTKGCWRPQASIPWRVTNDLHACQRGQAAWARA